MSNGKKCEWCGTPLSGRRIRFCCNKHKDQFHNKTNPRGYGANWEERTPTVPLDQHPMEQHIMDVEQWTETPKSL